MNLMNSKLPRRSLFYAAVAMLPALLTACSALDVLNATVPSDAYRSFANVPYGDQPRQRLDVYMPSQALADKALATGGTPLVVFFYGGSWSSGDRADYRFVGEALAAQGIAVVVADYRLSPEVRYPVFVQDSALAMRWPCAGLLTTRKSMVLTRPVFLSWATAQGLTTRPCWHLINAGWAGWV